MDFSMDICDAEEIKKEIKEDIKPMPEEVSKLKELSSKNANSLINIDISSLEERTSVLKSIDEFGLDTIEKSSHKNELLQVTIGKLSNTGDEGGDVANGLTELQRTLKDLDPSTIDFTKKGLFGRISTILVRCLDAFLSIEIFHSTGFLSLYL